MIKPTDLRIFNKVDTDNGIATIQLIDTVNVEVYYGEYPDENTKVLKHDEIKPIPLTEEWIKKLGFVEIYKYKENKNGLVRMALSTDETFVTKTYNGDSVKNSKGFHFDSDPDNLVQLIHLNHKIKYVNQLQNLYFNLTEEDLVVFK